MLVIEKYIGARADSTLKNSNDNAVTSMNFIIAESSSLVSAQCHIIFVIQRYAFEHPRS